MKGGFLSDKEYVELAHLTIRGPLRGMLPRDNTTVVAAALDWLPTLLDLSQGTLEEFCEDLFWAVAAVRAEQRERGIPA